MNFYVYIYLDGFTPILCGRVVSEEGSFRFRYDDRYLVNPEYRAIDPVYFRKTDQTIIHPRIVGAIRDGAPDQWGRKLMDTVAGHKLADWQYLLAADDLRIGDLAFGPTDEKPQSVVPWPNKEKRDLFSITLDRLIQDYETLEELEVVEDYIRDIISRYATLGGSRPKANVMFKDRICIAKFELRNDSFDNPRAEYATMTLAKKCGIAVPRLEIVNVRGRDVLLVDRFDRIVRKKTAQRIGALSGVTMTGGDEGSYEDLLMVLKRYGDQKTLYSQSHELFRRIIFNILVNNIDDHLRNHMFLRDGVYWRLSPAYDIVASTSQSNTHALSIGKYGALGTIENALSICEKYYISLKEAKKIVTKLSNITSQWREHFIDCGIPKGKVDAYKQAFSAYRIQ